MTGSPRSFRGSPQRVLALAYRRRGTDTNHIHVVFEQLLEDRFAERGLAHE
ncbi:MAG: hypothetical protein IPO51_07665 [Dehalococcoidia bacterium]|nr:hypothetical protein [Dehalococcoidia bacterium]